jgi:hypothetical protein
LNHTCIKDVVARSEAPIGSLYQYFPAGKSQLVREALARNASKVTGLIAECFDGKRSAAAAVRMLFTRAADGFERAGADKGCAIAGSHFARPAAGSRRCSSRSSTGRATRGASDDALEAIGMDSLIGRTIRWTCDDGPMAGVTIDREFFPDGSVSWTIVSGEHKGASRREKACATVKASDQIWVMSYLAASGHTLTAVLNLDDAQVFGFGSDEKTLTAVRGSFEIRP